MSSSDAARALLQQIEEVARAGLTGGAAPEDALRRIGAALSSAGRDPGASDARVLRNIVDHIPYVVFWKNRESQYLGCNLALAHIAGLSRPEDVIGKDDFAMPWTTEEAEFFREVDRRVMESGQPELDIEETQVQADGRTRVILTSKVPLRSDRGDVVGILGIFTDITARKELERELVRAKEVAEASARAKADFLATMSHELRTPLTLILSPIESLLNDRRATLPAEVVETLDSAYRNAYRLKVLTDDILSFSKQEAGRLEVSLGSVVLAGHVRGLIRDFEPAAHARGLTLRFDASRMGEAPSLVDVAKLDKVLVNLLSNALKFSPAGGEVTVALGRDDGWVVLEVRDTGIGIAPSEQPRLFRRFEQLDAGASRAYGGTGLGLSVVKALVEVMGGSVSVESEQDAGATFTVRLPDIPGTAADDAARATSPTTPHHLGLEPVATAEPSEVVGPPGAPLVVIAEDSSELRKYLVRLLAGEFRVAAAANGHDAFGLVFDLRPDVLVSDVMMPRMDGYELVAKVKADPVLAATPVLLLTARAGAEASADSLSRGADGYLSKPFSPSELIAHIRAAHRMKELNRSLLEAERRVSEARRSEALRRTQVELAELTRIATLGEMTAAVAHELTQPLVAVSASANACSRWLGGATPNLEEARKAATAMQRDSARASEVIRRIRELFRGASSEHAPLQVSEAIAEIIALTEPKLSECGAALRVQVADDLPVIRGDRIQLQQVIINLVVNAAESTRDVEGRPREVTLRVSTDGGGVRVEVGDTGVGVAPELATRIFEPLRTTKPNGMGMGLSISRTIVEAHGGTLRFYANDGPGTTFVFALPGRDGPNA